MKQFFFFTFFTFFAFSLQAQIVSNGLVAKYSFNNGNADDEVNNNHGVVVGATLTADRFGNSNKAYHFNNSYIKVAHSPQNDLNNLAAISISTWIHIDTFVTGLGAIIAKWNGGSSEQYGIFLNGNDNHVAIRSVNNFGITDTANYSLRNWHHVVLTFNRSTNEHKVYVNNVNVLSQITGGVYSPSTDSTSLSFGAQASDFNNGPASPYRYFKGAIDDIRIYNRVLTASDVDSLYNESNPMVLGLNDHSSTQLNQAISVFPNPSKASIFFSQQSNVKLIDLSGRVLLEQQNTNSLDSHQLASGLYLLLFSDEKGQIIQQTKFVKE